VGLGGRGGGKEKRKNSVLIREYRKKSPKMRLDWGRARGRGADGRLLEREAGILQPI